MFNHVDSTYVHLRCPPVGSPPWRPQERLFGAAPSDSTTYRTFRGIGRAVLDDRWEAMATVRAKMRRRSSVTNIGSPVIVDIDATLVEIHSESKAGTAATYKGGFGFHPLLCFADATGETRAALLRPGNAGANTSADHLCALDAVLRRARGGIAAAGGDPSAIGSVIFPLRENFGDSSTRADRAQRRP
jgi:hypothetical protein